MDAIPCPCGSGRMILLERASAEGQPVSEARCSSCKPSISAMEAMSLGAVDAPEDVVVAEKRSRVRRGGRGRGGKPRSVSPAMSLTSLCLGVYRLGVEDEGYVQPLDKLGVVLDEKREGYSYVGLLRPSVINEVVTALGPSPTLRSLLRVGPSKFLPVDTLSNVYVLVGEHSAKVVSSPTVDGAYAKFWAVVRSIPEHELSFAWKEKMRFGWRWCAVPCVYRPGYRIL